MLYSISHTQNYIVWYISHLEPHNWKCVVAQIWNLTSEMRQRVVNTVIWICQYHSIHMNKSNKLNSLYNENFSQVWWTVKIWKGEILIAIYKSHYIMTVCDVPNYFSHNTSLLNVLHFRDECKTLIGKFPCLFILPYLCRGLANIIDDNARSSGLLNKKIRHF